MVRDENPGSGLEFLDELDRVVRPDHNVSISSLGNQTEIRRRLFTRYPYAVIYGIEYETIVIISVAHTHREPRYWIDRLTKKSN